MKRLLALLLALVMIFSLTGCSKKVKTEAKSGECGTFEISGTLGTSGTVKLTGTVFDKRDKAYKLKDATYTYKRSGSSVTMTRKGITNGPKTISGTYNSLTNTFTLDNKTACELYKAFGY